MYLKKKKGCSPTQSQNHEQTAESYRSRITLSIQSVFRIFHCSQDYLIVLVLKARSNNVQALHFAVFHSF